MGRSLSTQTDLFNEVESKLKEYRRLLRFQDKQAFDAILVHARKHLASINMAAHFYPLEMYLISITLEQERNRVRMEDTIGQIQNLYDDLEKLLRQHDEKLQNLENRIETCENTLHELSIDK